MASFIPNPVFRFMRSHYVVLGAGIFLWALMIGTWYLIVSS
jgi:hypothetical protein